MILYWAVVAVVTLPVFLVARSVLFKDWADFFDAIGYWFKPDILSAFHGDYWEDVWAEIRLGILLLVTGGAGVAFHLKAGPALQSWLGSAGLM